MTGNTFSTPEAALLLVLTQRSAASGDESAGNGRTVQTVGSFSNDDSDGGEESLSKMNLYFTFDCRNSAKSVQYAYWSKNLLWLNKHRQRTILKEDTKNYPLWFTFSKLRRIWSFHVVVLQRTAKKCTKIQNARAEPLFGSLNLFFLLTLSTPSPSWFAKTPYSTGTRAYSRVLMKCNL